MTKNIRYLFLRLGTTEEIWDSVKKTYLVDQNASKAYQLYCEVISIRHNGESVISYFGKLQEYGRNLMILMIVLWSVKMIS